MPEFSMVIDDSEIGIDFDEGVQHYPYRTATVADRFRESRRDSASDIFENLLASAAGVNINNHVVYGVTLDNGKPLYILIHDDWIIYGWSVKEGLW